MQFALFFPERIEKLVVVDMAPRAYSGGHESILQAMRGLPVTRLSSRKEAETQLLQQIPEKEIVRFLMKNLSRSPHNGFEWKFNLDVLYRDYGAILAAVEETGEPYAGETLFVGGSRSHYIQPEDEPDIKRLFPKAEIIRIADAGHWVHAEQPDLLYRRVRDFLDGNLPNSSY
jgi:pimeloyl-ACP methyl ester carboxylesterase